MLDGLQSDFKDSIGYARKHCLKKQERQDYKRTPVIQKRMYFKNKKKTVKKNHQASKMTYE